jgi:hypothetical protein
LVTHLRQAHSDMEGASSQIYPTADRVEAVEMEQEQYDVPDEYNNSNIGSDFAELALDRDMGPEVECAVCLETFARGQKVIRMECFCLYHSPCVQLWWKKNQGSINCPTHIHYE